MAAAGSEQKVAPAESGDVGSNQGSVITLEEYRPETYAEDGGFKAWFIVACAFLANFVLDGINYSTNDNGLRHDILACRHDNGSASDSCSENHYTYATSKYSVVQATILGFYLCSGPFVSVLIEKLGFRIVGIAGSLIASFGIFLALIISHFTGNGAPNFYALIICVGVLGGIGFGMMYVPSIVIVGLHFDYWRTLSTGIACAGTGAGQFIFPLMIKPLVDKWGWKAVYIMNGTIAAFSALLALAYFPLPERTIRKKYTVDRLSGERRPSLTPPKKKRQSLSLESMFRSSVSYFQSPTFLLIAFSGFVMLFGYPMTYAFIEARAEEVFKDNKTADELDEPAVIKSIEKQAQLVILTIGICNGIGRLVFGLLAVHPKVNQLTLSNTAVIIMGIFGVFVPLMSKLWHFIVYGVVFGFCAAIFVTMRSIIVIQFMGVEDFNNAFGISLFFMGVGAEVGAPLGGLLKDETTNYEATFFLSGLVLICGGVMLLPLQYVKDAEEARKQEAANEYNVISEPSEATSLILEPLNESNKKDSSGEIKKVEAAKPKP